MGKVILIAGALGTLGVGVAEDFRARGATVIIAPGRSFAPDLMALYAGYIVIDGEVSDPFDLALRCDEIERQHGRLDLVVFCSGTALPQRAEEIPASNTPDQSPTLLRRLRAKLIAKVQVQSPVT